MERHNKLLFVELIHFILIALLVYLTIGHLDHVSYVQYLLLVGTYSLGIFFSVFLQISYQRGTFFYLLSILMFLSFPFKFSIHEIFNTPYYEPVGLFNYTNSAFSGVISVAIIGGLGILLAQVVSYYFFIRNKHIARRAIHEKESVNNYKMIFLGALLILIMGAINLKYNVLLVGVTPDVILPFKGNTIFFLILTRFLPLLLLYYGVVSFSYVGITLGSLIFSLSSVGVVSRMGIVIYFFVITISLLQHNLVQLSHP